MNTRWLLLALFVLSSASEAHSPRRVACVGDSITYGMGIDDRGRLSYPAVLERLSEGRFVVGNFGVSGSTVLPIPHRAWVQTQACRDAIDFAPDIVVIMLGINDLAHPGLHNRYPDELRRLVERFLRLPAAPHVFVCTLTPIAPEEHQMDVNRTIQQTLNPAIRAVAVQTGASIIDIHSAFPNQLDLLPDGVHPNAEGAEWIARTVLAAIEAAHASAPPIQPAPASGPPSLSIHNEAVAAIHRAELWLSGQPKPEHMPDPAQLWGETLPQTLEEVISLLPLLDGEIPEGVEDLYFSYAALAVALDHLGQTTIFLDGQRPVAWREALVHQLVQRQQIDPRGGGFWINPRSTIHALQSLSSAGVRH